MNGRRSNLVNISTVMINSDHGKSLVQISKLAKLSPTLITARIGDSQVCGYKNACGRPELEQVEIYVDARTKKRNKRREERRSVVSNKAVHTTKFEGWR